MSMQHHEGFSDAQGWALLELEPGGDEKAENRDGDGAHDDAEHEGFDSGGEVQAGAHVDLRHVHGSLGCCRGDSRSDGSCRDACLSRSHEAVAVEERRHAGHGHKGSQHGTGASHCYLRSPKNNADCALEPTHTLEEEAQHRSEALREL